MEKARGLAGAATNLVWLPLVGAASEIARSRLERRVERVHAAREEARRRASEERLLIARELHDVPAHDISLINVQSVDLAALRIVQEVLMPEPGKASSIAVAAEPGVSQAELVR